MVITNESGVYETFEENFTINQVTNFDQTWWEIIVSTSETIVQGTYCSNVTISQFSNTNPPLLTEISTIEDCFAVVPSFNTDDWWEIKATTRVHPTTRSCPMSTAVN